MQFFNSLLKLKLAQILFLILLVYYNLFNTIECSGMDPNLILHPEETSVSSLNVSSNLHPSESNSFQKTSSTEIKVVAESDSITVLGKGLETVGQSLKEISPAIAVGAITGGTATILKTLPPKERVGALLVASAVSTGGYIITNAIHSITTDKDLSSPGSPNFDNFINSPLENDFYSISSPLEFNNIEETLTFGMILMIGGVFYGVTLMLMNQFIRLLKLESREFVIKRPLLNKWILFSSKVRDWDTLILIIVIWISLGMILFTSIYLLGVLSIR